MASELFQAVLRSRGLTGPSAEAFLLPNYDTGRHDPFLLPDMRACVQRLLTAHEKQEKITIYGDYDIDGLTATTVLLDSFKSFGYKHVDAFIPNRFVEGYGLTIDAVEKIAADGANLIVTVDCGSLSEKEIIRAAELGVDVIVTDHHNVAPIQPPAIGVINPKRLLAEHPEKYENFILKDEFRDQKLYPFLDLPGVGVAFKLVQALATRLNGLDSGQEKWLLDLVALGTVCDIVTLRDENRLHVFYGLKVLAKTRRPGLKALMAVSKVEPEKVSARSLGFGLGPRMNAAGRLETATHALEMLTATDGLDALNKAQFLDQLNATRRADQDAIFKEATLQAEKFNSDPVLVLSDEKWSHGIIGIVAAKILEKYHKPTYVLQEMGQESKGSARSFGDFSAADAIRFADDIITKGGGHKLAAGVTLPTENIPAFRKRVNEFYRTQKLFNQEAHLLPRADVDVERISQINFEYLEDIASLEPFGSGNPEPILKLNSTVVHKVRKMGADGQHLKIGLSDSHGGAIDCVAFSAPESFFVSEGEKVNVWIQPNVNEWNGRRSVEARLLHMELA